MASSAQKIDAPDSLVEQLRGTTCVVSRQFPIGQLDVLAVLGPDLTFNGFDQVLIDLLFSAQGVLGFLLFVSAPRRRLPYALARSSRKT